MKGERWWGGGGEGGTLIFCSVFERKSIENEENFVKNEVCFMFPETILESNLQ